MPNKLSALSFVSWKRKFGTTDEVPRSVLGIVAGSKSDPHALSARKR